MDIIFALLFFFASPCEHEDSTNCSWNAQVQGNGEGDSFVDIGGTAFYID